MNLNRTLKEYTELGNKWLEEGEYFIAAVNHSPDYTLIPALDFFKTNKGNWFEGGFGISINDSLDRHDLIKRISNPKDEDVVFSLKKAIPPL